MLNSEKDCPNCKHHDKNWIVEEPCKSCIESITMDRLIGWEESEESKNDRSN